VGGQHHAPAASPPGKTRYSLCRRLGGPQGRSGRVRNISPPPGFDPRTVQTIASCYTDWATRPTKSLHKWRIFCFRMFIAFSHLSGQTYVYAVQCSHVHKRVQIHFSIGLAIQGRLASGAFHSTENKYMLLIRLISPDILYIRLQSWQTCIVDCMTERNIRISPS
jgi:hypothetical protein